VPFNYEERASTCKKMAMEIAAIRRPQNIATTKIILDALRERRRLDRIVEEQYVQSFPERKLKTWEQIRIYCGMLDAINGLE
jgi:hypothetical protein